MASRNYFAAVVGESKLLFFKSKSVMGKDIITSTTSTKFHIYSRFLILVTRQCCYLVTDMYQYDSNLIFPTWTSEMLAKV